jgi:ketosteroid isomerase-like protein
MKTLNHYIIYGTLITSSVNAQAAKTAVSTTHNVNTMNTEKLTNPVIKQAIDALQSGDQQAWFALFTNDTQLFDDGNKMNFKSFFEKALGHERFTSIDKIEHNGTHVYGKFHSDKWGDFKTYFKFTVDADGKISKLEIGQASY